MRRAYDYWQNQPGCYRNPKEPMRDAHDAHRSKQPRRSPPASTRPRSREDEQTTPQEHTQRAPSGGTDKWKFLCTNHQEPAGKGELRSTEQHATVQHKPNRQAHPAERTQLYQHAYTQPTQRGNQQLPAPNTRGGALTAKLLSHRASGGS